MTWLIHYRRHRRPGVLMQVIGAARRLDMTPHGRRSSVVRRMAVLSGSLVLFVVLLAAAPSTASAGGAASVSADSDAFKAACSISAAGILTGWDTAEGVLQQYVTRGELAVMLAKSLGLKGSVGELQEAGLIPGSAATVFAPDELISRREAVSWIMSALHYKLAGNRWRPPVSARLSYFDSADTWLQGFRDRPLIGADYSRALAGAYRMGIVDTTADGWFYPTLALSWGDAALMLDRAFVHPPTVRTTPASALPGELTYPSLKQKSTGPLVWYLEHQLTRLKYCPGYVDGLYDDFTRDAVLAFEKVERLKRTGTVEAAVWERLVTAQTPLPKKTDVGTRVEIDLSRQVLFMVTDNKVWKIVHVSTGSTTRRTRVGHFKVEDKQRGWVSCTTVRGRMFYPSYVVSKTAIHGYRQVPVYPASHGCIRVPVWMAEELWQQTPSGMTVDIYYNK
jgi:lipoprotein-anchoring transpeptidase ErfK/SrfK